MSSIVSASRSRTSSARRKVGAPGKRTIGVTKGSYPNEDAATQRHEAKQAALTAYRKLLETREGLKRS